MTNYRAILQYYYQGNTTTQIATICQCSRTTVLKTIKRAKEIQLDIPVSNQISDRQLYIMLYPKRGRREEYYLPDWYALDKDKKKRSYTKFRAWQKYCRVAKKLGMKAYGKSRFYALYKKYFTPDFSHGTQLKQNLIKIYAFQFNLANIANTFGTDSNAYLILNQKIDKWCKKLRLDRTKIFLDNQYVNLSLL